MLRAVLTAPVAPAHRSKASGGRDPGLGVPSRLEVPRPRLGRFDDPLERWPLPCTREGGLSSTDERVRLRGHVTEVTQALSKM